MDQLLSLFGGEGRCGLVDKVIHIAQARRSRTWINRSYRPCAGCPRASVPRLPWFTCHPTHPAWTTRTRAHPRAHGIDAFHLLPLGSSSHPRPRWAWSRRPDVAIHTVLLRGRIAWIDGLSSSVGWGSDPSIPRSVPSTWVSQPLLSDGLKGTTRPMERDER